MAGGRSATIAATGIIIQVEVDVALERAVGVERGPAAAAHIVARPAVTIRGLVDCMIAAVARRHQATLLTCDADLNRVARMIGIELDQPHPEPPQPT